MSRLSFDAASGFYSIEVVTSAIIPSAGEAHQALSFDRCLKQAAATVDARAEADAARPTDPGNSYEDRSSAAAEPTPDSDRQAGVSDAQAASDEPGVLSEEEEDEQSAADSARPAGALDVEALSQRANPESCQGDSAVEDVAHQSQGPPLDATQLSLTTTATDESPLGDSEESGPIDTQTESADESSAERKGDAVEATQVRESETIDDGRNASDAAGPPTADASPQGKASPADSRRRERSSRVGAWPGDGPVADEAASTETARSQQPSKTASPVEAPNGVESDGGENAAAGSISSETGEGEAGAPLRAWANQGTRPTLPARGPETSGPDQADRVRFVQRVARAFETMGDRGGSVRLRLHPPELGSLRLEVTVRNGSMTARLEVESDSARTMLLDNLPALRDRLAQQHIKVARFDVELPDPSSGGSPERPGEHPQPHDQPRGEKPEAHSDPDADGEGPSPPNPVTQPGQGRQLDVVI